MQLEEEEQWLMIVCEVPLFEVLSPLPRCANGMKGGGPPATSECTVSRLCAAKDWRNTHAQTSLSHFLPVLTFFHLQSNEFC